MSRRNLVTAVALALVAGVAVVVVACSGGGRAEMANGRPEGDAVLENLVARIYEGDDLANVVRASRGVVDLAGGKADLEDVDVSFYAEGELAAELSSRWGTMFLRDRPDDDVAKSDFVLEGGARYEAPDGTVFTVPRLRYSSRRQRLISSGGPYERRVPRENGYLLFTGERFEMSKDMTELWEYKGQVRTVNSSDTSAQ